MDVGADADVAVAVAVLDEVLEWAPRPTCYSRRGAECEVAHIGLSRVVQSDPPGVTHETECDNATQRSDDTSRACAGWRPTGAPHDNNGTAPTRHSPAIAGNRLASLR